MLRYERVFATLMSVLELLADAVEGLDPSTIGTSPGTLAEAFGLFDRLRARLSEAVGVFDTSGLWAVDGATSMTAWLKVFARLSGTNAAGFTGLARRLRSMPATTRALTDGRLSTDQVRAITACVDPDLVAQYTDTEDDLIGVVESLSVHDISQVMQHWRERARHTIPDPHPRHEQRSLHLSGLLDGTFRVDGTARSGGGCNEVSVDLGGGSPVEDLAGSDIHFGGDVLEVGVADLVEVGAFREVLA